MMKGAVIRSSTWEKDLVYMTLLKCVRMLLLLLLLLMRLSKEALFLNLNERPCFFPLSC